MEIDGKETNATAKAAQAREDTSVYEVREISSSMAKEQQKTLLETIAKGIQLFKGDFWIEVQHFKDTVIEQNAVRFKTVLCSVCPVPTWNHTVYRYYRDIDGLRPLWTLPSVEYAEHVKKQKNATRKEVPHIENVAKFYDGTLDKICARHLEDSNKDDVAFALQSRGKKV